MENKKKILVIEDEPTLRKEITQKMTASDYQVLEAVNGDEGIQLFLKEKPDCLLIDISLPTIDGVKTLHYIRNNNEHGKTVPAIFLTNLDPNEQMLQSIPEEHPSYYLVKAEMNLDDLVNKVKECVQ